MPTELRHKQALAVDDAVDYLRTVKAGATGRLYASPTGTGKSYVLAGILRRMAGQLVLVVPTIEIAVGIHEKLTGIKTSELSEAAQREATEACNIYTAKRLLNLIREGAIPPPKYMAFDEAHHTEDNTHTESWHLAGQPPRVGLTATPYRGTAKETAELHAQWGHEINWIYTLAEAVTMGFIAQPTFDVWPLLNDETVDVTGGEFVVKQVTAKTKSVVDELSQRIGQFYNGSEWDRATILRVQSIGQGELVCAGLLKAGLPHVFITGKDTQRERNDAFAAAVVRSKLLVNVRTVTEGIDLPLRRFIDIAPTMSPVLWMQTLGRITRPIGPGEAAPEYIACCHNLLRHAYLWKGLIPAAEVRKARSAWGEDYTPSRRTLTRAIGLEGFGRFKPTEVPLSDGTMGLMYGYQVKDGTRQWVVFLHPCLTTPLYFYKEQAKAELKQFELPGGQTQTRYVREDYGKWAEVDHVEDVQGALSLKADPLTPGQKKFWRTAGWRYGLKGDEQINARQFAMLPVCVDTETKLRFT